MRDELIVEEVYDKNDDILVYYTQTAPHYCMWLVDDDDIIIYDEIEVWGVYDETRTLAVDDEVGLELDYLDVNFHHNVYDEIDELDCIEWLDEEDDGEEEHLELEQIDDEIDDDALELYDDEVGVVAEIDEIELSIYVINQTEHIE